MGEFETSTPVEASRLDIARECLHWAVTSGSPETRPASVTERAQVYFDWVIKTGQEPQTAGGSVVGTKAADDSPAVPVGVSVVGDLTNRSAFASSLID